MEVGMPNQTKSNATISSSPTPLSLEETMTAILAILVAEREERLGRGGGAPTELLLSDVGLDYGAISRVIGRPYKTVQTTIRRAREAQASKAGAKH